MAKREHINEYFNGRSFMVLCAVLLVAVTVAATAWGVKPPTSQGQGIFFSFKAPLIADSLVSAVVNVLCLLLTGGILLAVNKVYTFVRSMTHLCVSAFFLLQMANPSGLVSFHAGTLMCVVMALTLPPLFAAYQDRHSQRSVFLIFALVAAGCMFHYGFLVLIPAFLLGFLNMGVLNLKGVLAMLFGLVTPFWIVLGLGIVHPADAVAPQWIMQQWPAVTPLIVLAAVTAVLGIVLAAMNLHTIMNYRMQTRVYNAFFIITMVLAIVALCLDYQDLNVYLPLLNLMVAVQVAQVHSLRTSSFRYICLLLFIAGCLGFCALNLMSP
ncbi:MAG: hypothetical protein IKX56_07110 [Muribaculaceae bacterium]|nr:hypothetical protein [Muribaculaceae bacterium]